MREEARTWLRGGNTDFVGLDAGRLRKLVEALYRAGARSVLVEGDKKVFHGISVFVPNRSRAVMFKVIGLLTSAGGRDIQEHAAVPGRENVASLVVTADWRDWRTIGTAKVRAARELAIQREETDALAGGRWSPSVAEEIRAAYR